MSENTSYHLVKGSSPIEIRDRCEANKIISIVLDEPDLGGRGWIGVALYRPEPWDVDTQWEKLVQVFGKAVSFELNEDRVRWSLRIKAMGEEEFLLDFPSQIGTEGTKTLDQTVPLFFDMDVGKVKGLLRAGKAELFFQSVGLPYRELVDEIGMFWDLDGHLGLGHSVLYSESLD